MSLRHFTQTHVHSLSSVLHLYNELCSKGFHILFCWVPAYVGIKGNEAAGKAEKQACNPLNLPVPYSDLKLAITLFIREKWQKEWDMHSENKLNEIKPYITIWFTINPRKIDVIITRLRTGHSRLTHRHLLLAEDVPICLCCHSSAFTIHLLLTVCVGL